ncbi:hypothetical protein MHBO_001928 [Bonamia ostreae]|uniref:Uncharacterized protein n=1 Tax=Bonamia ostreae TaxID=126728 RepID=A0ABV2AKP6_9EUKA
MLLIDRLNEISNKDLKSSEDGMSEDSFRKETKNLENKIKFLREQTDLILNLKNQFSQKYTTTDQNIILKKFKDVYLRGRSSHNTQFDKIQQIKNSRESDYDRYKKNVLEILQKEFSAVYKTFFETVDTTNQFFTETLSFQSIYCNFLNLSGRGKIN